MLYASLIWDGPHLLASMDLDLIPEKPGVYVLSEYSTPLRPNPRRPIPADTNYEAEIEHLRSTPCILYVGKASNLNKRVRGYRFKPYLEIVRRPAGTPARHTADRHKGRALLHAQQYFGGPMHLWWTVTSSAAKAKTTEDQLLTELQPVLNTVGMGLNRPGE
ncbi:MAG: hypothetical protein DCC68_25080 [Planctomycetota bacterium]|nr:MAG: hypothetical protein DCC68_25080 [Planctomycetota bacterium]